MSKFSSTFFKIWSSCFDFQNKTSLTRFKKENFEKNCSNIRNLQKLQRFRENHTLSEAREVFAHGF